jgi:hypothetical protein
MISFHFNIANFGRSLTADRDDRFDWDRTWQVSTNKSFELQVTHWSFDRLLSFQLDTHFWGSDHAGPEVSLELFGWYFAAKLYDHRHWNYEAGRFMTEAEHKAEEEEWLRRHDNEDADTSSSEEVDTQVQPS